MKSKAMRREPEDDLRSRYDLQFRLLQCDQCASVWPTERDEKHGGARLDGDPCAYRWADGRVCGGRVYPFGSSPRAKGARQPRPERAWVVGDGVWCEVLGLPRGTSDIAVVRKAYRALVLKVHPDAGGSHDEMVRLNRAYALALAELGQP